MTAITEPLRAEHRELLPHVEQLRQAADTIEAEPTADMAAAVDEAIEFLTHHLIPHARAEEAALYPAVASAMGAPGATATMSRDHVEVLRLTDELRLVRGRLGKEVSDFDARELRRLLYGLYAVVGVHFAKEEEVYLPLLDGKLSEAEARAMFEAMEAAAGEAKAAAIAE